ncbi:MAG TPA: uroporphyrinogen decarboxylase, partial [Clostridiaceae bacterium]|nr:uroporphyrinogen decarboxylase [Clostridiaceae bacterium]
DKPLIEVFTIDSVQCAACTYMMAAANVAKEHFGDQIDVVEYKYVVKDNILRTMKMGIKNLPTMCINGESKFISIIPSEQELFAEIEKVM